VADDLRFGDFTTSEKLRLAGLIARAGKRGMAGPDVDISDLTRRIESIERAALRRKQKNK
jgi:hypothetical protein